MDKTDILRNHIHEKVVIVITDNDNDIIVPNCFCFFLPENF